MADNSLSPLTGKERKIEIDILRGFALFGVLLVNVVSFNYPLFSQAAGYYPLGNPMVLEGFEKFIALIIYVFARAKFYPIFSILFGLGFYIFISRVRDKGYSEHLFYRRSFILFLFGLLHLLFVWHGDILHIYAICGFLLLAPSRLELKDFRYFTIVIVFASILFYTSIAFLEEWMIYSGQVEGSNPELANQADKALNLFREGDYNSILFFRLKNELPLVLTNLLVSGPNILGLILMGVYMGMTGILWEVDSNFSLIRKYWKVTGVIGGLSTLVYVALLFDIFNYHPLLDEPLYELFFRLASVFLALFYIFTVLIIMKTRKGLILRILTPFKYLGRMALTNYLLQCIICAFIFYGFGLGLIGRMHLGLGVIFTVFLFTIQICLSKLWLYKFQYGPLEWIWRKMTYARAKKIGGRGNRY